MSDRSTTRLFDLLTWVFMLGLAIVYATEGHFDQASTWCMGALLMSRIMDRPQP